MLNLSRLSDSPSLLLCVVTPQMEHILFPAVRLMLSPPRTMATDGTLLQIADLHDLYKVRRYPSKRLLFSCVLLVDSFSLHLSRYLNDAKANTLEANRERRRWGGHQGGKIRYLRMSVWAEERYLRREEREGEREREIGKNERKSERERDRIEKWRKIQRDHEWCRGIVYDLLYVCVNKSTKATAQWRFGGWFINTTVCCVVYNNIIRDPTGHKQHQFTPLPLLPVHIFTLKRSLFSCRSSMHEPFLNTCTCVYVCLLSFDLLDQWIIRNQEDSSLWDWAGREHLPNPLPLLQKSERRCYGLSDSHHRLRQEVDEKSDCIRERERRGGGGRESECNINFKREWTTL